MSIERASGDSSLIDVLDRVLDKGIVIDAWVRLSLVGIDLVTVEARVVVASIATYLQYSEPLGAPAVFTSVASAPRLLSFQRATPSSNPNGRPPSHDAVRGVGKDTFRDRLRM